MHEACNTSSPSPRVCGTSTSTVTSDRRHLTSRPCPCSYVSLYPCPCLAQFEFNYSLLEKPHIQNDTVTLHQKAAKDHQVCENIPAECFCVFVDSNKDTGVLVAVSSCLSTPPPPTHTTTRSRRVID